MLELNKLYNMDCMQGMKEFPDGFFDLAIVDPPYGIGIDGQKKRVCGNPKHNRKEHIRKSWDKAIPPPEYFRELERVSKAQVIWGGNYFVPYLEQGHKGWLVWDKGQHGLTMSDCELAYMRMSGAMLAECAEVCFLPDWKESKGAKYEFGEAMAQNKPFFFFADWERTQEETGKYECTAEKTDKIAFQCFVCGKINVFPATHADGNTCKYCGGGLKAIGYAKKTEGSRNAEK